MPTNFQLEITENCNHRCFYCYNSFREKPLRDDLNIKEIAQKAVESGVFHGVITGGEPLLRKDKLLDVASVFEREHVSFSLNSNMTLADKQILEGLKKFGLTNILVSLMSYDPKLMNK